jgi:hypothetical protein
VSGLLISNGSNAQLHFALLFCSYSKIKIKLISGGMQFLTLNQGCTKFNFLVRHNIKYDKISSLHNIKLISETMTWGKLIAATEFGTRMNIVLTTRTLKIGE